jgi:hypothetical protein
MTTLEKLQTIDFNEDNFWATAGKLEPSDYNLDESDIPQLLEIGRNKEWNLSEKSTEWAINGFALVILHKLKSVEGMHLTYKLAYENEDFSGFEAALLIKFAKSNSIDFVALAETHYSEASDWLKNTLADGITIAVETDSSIKEAAEKFYINELKNHKNLTESNNGFLILGLTKLGKGKEYYQLIKQILEANNVDIMVMGDLEDFEIEIGIRTERETVKVNPFAKIQEKLKSFQENVRKENPKSLKEKLSGKGKKKLNLKKMKKKKKK